MIIVTNHEIGDFVSFRSDPSREFQVKNISTMSFKKDNKINTTIVYEVEDAKNKRIMIQEHLIQ